MIKLFTATAVTLLSLIGAASASSIGEIKEASRLLYKNGTPICSGQFVNDKTFLTAAHCVSNNDMTKVDKDAKYTLVEEKFNDKGKVVVSTSYLFEIDKYVRENDVATLKPVDPELTFPHIEVATDEESKGLEILDETVAATYHISKKSLDLTFTPGVYNGVVRAYPEWKPEDFVISSTSGVAHGSSGGGLYAKFGDTWKLIGVVEGGQGDSDIHLFSTTDSINDILKIGVTEDKDALRNK